MHPAGNMAAPYRGGNISSAKASRATSKTAVTNSRSATSRGAEASNRGAVGSSRGYVAANRGATSTATTSSNVYGTGQPPNSHQGHQTSETLFFILLKDKEVQGKASESLLSQRHTPSSKKILRGSLLQGFKTPQGGGPRVVDKGRGAVRMEGIRFTVKPLIGDMEFECDSSEINRITIYERDMLRALHTDSQRFEVFVDENLMTYALALKERSVVKVKHRNDNTSPYEDATAIVRYIGPLSGSPMGTHFGLELRDSKHRGQGTSDGEFGKKRYFRTDIDCAIFVSIHKLIPTLPRSEPVEYDDARHDFKRELPHRPEELTSVGEIQKGMTVHFQIGSAFKSGKVVFITIPQGQSEPHVVVEMPKHTGDHNQRWDGYFDEQYIYTPREDVYTHFFPAISVIPEHLMMQYSEEKRPDVVVKEQVNISAPKEKSKAKKSSEPFFLSNNKQQTRKSSSPYTSSEKLDKAGHKGRHDVSDSYHHEREKREDDIQFSSGHYGEGNKSFVNIVKGKVGKIKSKFNNGSKDDEPSTKSSQWYVDRSIGVEAAARGGYPDNKQLLGDEDCLEDDVIEEVTNTIYRDWRTIGYSLYLNKDEIEQIEKMRSTEKERTVQMLNFWQKRGMGYDKISRLAEACRACNFADLANELEQGLDEDILMKIASGISREKCRPFGLYLNFSDSELDKMEYDNLSPVPQIRLMLAKWRTRQSHNSDKILLLCSALKMCGLRQLELEVARGLDDEIMLSFAIQIGHGWKILATTLRLELKDIKHLEDFSQDKQPYQMLMLWRRKQHRAIDVLGALSKGLRESGFRDLADDLVQGVDDSILYRLATLVGDTWEIIALHLGFSEEEVTSFKKDKASETNTIINMLNKWRERHDYTQHRFDFLMNALRESDLVFIAESFERDRHQRSQAMKEDCSAMKKTCNQDLPQDVTRELLIKVSKQITFKDLCGAMDHPTEDVISIENYYQTNDQRCFQLLDTWRRNGSGQKRSTAELLQIIAHIGGSTTLIDDIMTGEATDKKDDYQQTKEMPSDIITELPPLLPLDGVPPDGPPSPDLEVNSMVEVTTGMIGAIKRYGVIRWIGLPDGSRSDNLVAGIELESSIQNGATDGTFNKQRYFQCEPNKAMFVYLSRCRPDSRFPSQSQTFKLSKRQTSQDFGGFASPTVQGFIDPPRALQPNFVGMQKGIQGDQNSCYLDTTLFSMFAYNNVFDPLLYRTQGENDLQLYEDVQKILRESIVNPLRKNGFVRADHILQLREHLDNLGTTKGLMNEEKDPEEFLHTLLSEVFKSKPLLRIRHGGNNVVDESNIYQIFLDKDESFLLPTVEQLLLQSFQEHDLKLVETPSCMIVQMPRFGKEYKMYKRILPSIQLDITDIIEGYPRQCIVCGGLADTECSGCKTEEAVAETTHIKNYCTECYDVMHSEAIRSNHKPTKLRIPDQILKDFYSKSMARGFTEKEVDSHRQVILAPKLMELFAVICIRTSHYVAFVKAGREMDSEWVFFDSMADRQGDQQGYNIPQITHLKDFRNWVDKEHIKGRMESKQLTELMERLLGDAYICMYSDKEKNSQSFV